MNRLLIFVFTVIIINKCETKNVKFVRNSKIEKDWYHHAAIYQIYPRSFMDSDGDGIGDLNGITSKLSHLNEIGVNTIWLSPIFQSPLVDFGYDVSDFRKIHYEYGTMRDFELMISEAKRLKIRIMLDFVPNHSSNKHEWFERSVRREEGYENYYIWHNGRILENGTTTYPNNWISVFGGTAWTWINERQQYYLHQFSPGQPDLNYREKRVHNEMNDILKFWLQKGVDGFRLDAINHLFEIEDFRDEPQSNNVNVNSTSYDYLEHIYTKDLNEVYDMVYQWRELLDQWKINEGGDTRIIMTEAYANISFTMKYYQSTDGTRQGAHMPFNFYLIYAFQRDSKVDAIRDGINIWLDNLPSLEHVSNWVLGSHDHSRIGTRIGFERINIVNTILLGLPGTSITYYGDEIGMRDYIGLHIFDERDPFRTPMQWDNTTSAGFSSNTTTWLPVNENYHDINVVKEKINETSYYSYFKLLTKLRQEAAIIKGKYSSKIISDYVFAFERKLAEEDSFLFVINYGNQEESFDLTIFFNITDNLLVEISAPISKYIIGETVNSNMIELVEYDSIVFRVQNT